VGNKLGYELIRTTSISNSIGETIVFFLLDKKTGKILKKEFIIGDGK